MAVGARPSVEGIVHDGPPLEIMPVEMEVHQRDVLIQTYSSGIDGAGIGRVARLLHVIVVVGALYDLADAPRLLPVQGDPALVHGILVGIAREELRAHDAVIVPVDGLQETFVDVLIYAIRTHNHADW